MIDVLFVMLPNSLLLDLAGPAEAFRIANQSANQSPKPRFRLRFVGPEAQSVSSVGAILSNLEPLPLAFDPQAQANWIVLLGRPGSPANVLKPTPQMLAVRRWLTGVVAPQLYAPDNQRGEPYRCRLLTVCVGALLAADAGLLHGRRCTTHHELLEALARCSPDSKVVGNKVFVEDGAIATSAGVTAGIDLALHLIARECGEATASTVAQVMVAYARRTEADVERSPLLAWRSHIHAGVHRVQEAVTADPRRDWPTSAQAAIAHVTERHLNRLFQEHAGITPRDYVEQVRLAIAEHALRAGMKPTKVAQVSGFKTTRKLATARKKAP